MKPKAGYDYLATAAHFAAESSTGTNVNVCTTDDFTKSVDALVYYIDPDNEEMKIAYPNLLFDRNITDGRGMMCSFLTLAIGNNQGSLALLDEMNMNCGIKPFESLSQMFYKDSHRYYVNGACIVAYVEQKNNCMCNYSDGSKEVFQDLDMKHIISV